jgi:hypothetical protein
MFQAVHPVDTDFDALPYRYADTDSRDAPTLRERALWCAVLEQAFVDMGHPTAMENASGRAVAKHEARYFLLHSAVLRFVCELAGVSAATMRRAARLMDAGQMAFYIPPSGKQRSRNRGM